MSSDRKSVSAGMGRKENRRQYVFTKHRDALMHITAEEDIFEPGIAITNPMIGELPDINAVQEEVDELLLSM